MKLEHENVAAAEVDMDRQVIRVDLPAGHAGIAAALRRAFQGEVSEPCGRDFEDLLHRLN